MRRANVVSHSSPVATQAPHAAGLGLAIKLRGDDAVVLTTIGEGSTSQGEWYEAVNWAATHKLPVIFMVENNVYAISVRQDLQMAVEHVAEKAAGLGLPGVIVDGVDPVEVYRVVGEAAARARRGDGPTVIEAKVSRMTPHSSDDDDRSYRPRDEVEAMKARDPLVLFRQRLLADKVLTEAQDAGLQGEVKVVIEAAVTEAESAPYPAADEASHPVYVEDVRRG